MWLNGESAIIPQVEGKANIVNKYIREGSKVYRKMKKDLLAELIRRKIDD